MCWRLLIVDDHEPFREVAAQLLQAAGFTVVGDAADAASGLAAAQRLRPDVVLVDVQLPDVDGFQLTASLLAGPDAPKVVLISSREASDYGSRVGRSGAQGFIAKAELSGTAVKRVCSGGR